MDEAALQSALEEIDADGTGEISFDEFDQWCALGPQLLQRRGEEGGGGGKHEGGWPGRRARRRQVLQFVLRKRRAICNDGAKAPCRASSSRWFACCWGVPGGR